MAEVPGSLKLTIVYVLPCILWYIKNTISFYKIVFLTMSSACRSFGIQTQTRSSSPAFTGTNYYLPENLNPDPDNFAGFASTSLNLLRQVLAAGIGYI